LSDELIDIYGSPIWERFGERERVELNRRIAAWRLSVLLYGEQGAMLACSQLVDIVTGTDQKFFQATQVTDEARHNEVLERYLQARLDGLHYPMPENERILFDSILTDPRWYIKTIALQLVAETFAVAMFKMMAEAAVDPVLGEVCRRILQDESRHMGFGMLALPAIVREPSATRGLRPPFRSLPPGTQCEPQDVAGLGPCRPRRAIRKSEPQDVAGLGPCRPRRAIRQCEPQDGRGLGPGSVRGEHPEACTGKARARTRCVRRASWRAPTRAAPRPRPALLQLRPAALDSGAH